MGKLSTSAYETAVKLLARREHSRAELLQKLKSRGHSETEMDDALRQLCQEGLQSDSRFCEAYVHMRTGKGYGPLRIRAELQRRGIDEELISRCLEQDDHDWWQNAAEVRRKKYGGDMPEEFQERAKQARFLQYRGFSQAQIRSVLKDDVEFY